MSEETEREELRRVMPRPEEDAADELADALAHSRFRAERFGKQVDVKLDRYIVRRELGRGGMGVVFEAYDPVLMVPVALKLLQRVHGAREGDSESDLRMQREAQALARVEGDHVVRVYSAGFHKRQPWIAMQFVAGPDLHEWLRYRRERGELDWHEVLAKFVDAARGLASIHLAGLVHRDFKPQNAVVDPRGRVRVLDFGLATADRRPIDPGAAAAHLRHGGATSTAALVGTSRYASPEQFDGKDLDHRSDQFSFCVALYEALWGATPFGSEVSTGMRLATTEGSAAIPRPPASDVPGWLVAAVLRGLAYRPADRFPDMAALVHELTRDRHRGLRRAALLLGGGLLGGVVMAAAVRSPDRAAICGAQADVLDRVWRHSGLPAGVVAALERYAAAWKTSYRIACVDTHTLARAPETLLVRRQECLAGERARLAALLAHAGEPTTDGKLAAAVSEMAPPANCLDEGLGRVAAPRDPDTRLRVGLVDSALAEAHAERMLGDYHQAAEYARRAVAEALASDHRPALARAHFALGELERLRGRDEASAAALSAASAEAGLALDLPLQVRAEHELVRLALLSGHMPERASEHLQRAAATLAALPPERGAAGGARFTVDSLWAEHADMRGLWSYHSRRYGEAIAAHTEALRRWQSLAHEADLRREVAASLIDRGRAYSDDFQGAAALADYGEALRLQVAVLGPDHPSLATDYANLAIELRTVPDLDGALQVARTALQLDRLHHGPRSPQVALDYVIFAAIHQDRGELGLAREYARAAVAAYAGGGGPALHRANAEYALAMVAFVQGASDADVLFRRAAAAFRGIAGPEAACQRALAHVYRGIIARERGQLAAADEAAHDASVALAEAEGGVCEASGQLPWLRGHLAQRRGRLQEAVELFTEGLDEMPPSAPVRADMSFDLALAECELGVELARVESHVRAAQAMYEARGLHDRVRALDEFLAECSAKNRK